jgi:polysaccharide deacetylase family protein (PEP-CTERM system associated)
MLNALSVDVEDYFQVQALAEAIDRATWPAREPRIEQSTARILDLLAEADARATFFVLGWIAERFPALVRRIVAAGHELGCHGYAHVRVDRQTPEDFRRDVRKAKAILEDCTGVCVQGYRAATFSMGSRTPWAFPVLEEEGYAYSSSIYPVRHDYYANAGAPRFAYRPDGTRALWEFPISTLRIAGQNVPCGGGGYFRLYPYALSRLALTRINESGLQPAVFYVHPWELDPGQPRLPGLPLKTRLRHYLNLSKTAQRLGRLLQDFRWDRIDAVFAHLLAGAPRAASA